MSESSRSRVTITLGRSGQVVKRDGRALASSFTDIRPNIGSKRSVRERLGSNADSSAEVNNKRLRGDDRSLNAVYDLSKDDLRYKLMKKNMLKQGENSQQDGLDLRDILSRPAQSSTNSIFTRERMSESKGTRQPQMEPMAGRQHYAETRGGKHLPSVTQSSRQHIPEFISDNALYPRNRSVLDSLEGWRSFIEAKDVRHHMSEPSKPGMLPYRPGTRPSNSIPRMESGVNSYSPWTLDRIRQRSPDASLTVSRNIVAPRRDEVSHRRYAVRAYDEARTSTYMCKDALDVSKPMNSSDLAKMAPPIGQRKPMATVASPHPLPGSLVQKSSHMVDEQLTVDSFLRSLGLEKYAIIFKAEEVDMYSLRRMAERDLKELGIPMGPRKKILLSLQPHLKQQA